MKIGRRIQEALDWELFYIYRRRVVQISKIINSEQFQANKLVEAHFLRWRM